MTTSQVSRWARPPSAVAVTFSYVVAACRGVVIDEERFGPVVSVPRVRALHAQPPDSHPLTGQVRPGDLVAHSRTGMKCGPRGRIKRLREVG